MTNLNIESLVKTQPAVSKLVGLLPKISSKIIDAAKVPATCGLIVAAGLGLYAYRKVCINRLELVRENTTPRPADCIEDVLEVEEDAAAELTLAKIAKEAAMEAALNPGEITERVRDAAKINAQPSANPLTKRKTRVRPNKTGQFIRVLRAEIKAQMGTPTITAANEAVIRHMISKFCASHNIRTTSYAHLISRVVREIMTPYPGDAEEVERANSVVNRIHNWLVQYRK
nr:putative 25K replicase component [Carrot red leaf luteovirus associated RNA]